jgi:5-(carboxyamino)imidazole ribonucleotide synthase
LIFPIHCVGVMGSGQLGRMFAQEAIQLGYAVHVYSPEQNSPAAKVGAREWVGSYLDFEKLREFLSSIHALTFEFENIPLATLDFIEENFPLIQKNGTLRPNIRSLKIAQDRILEKEHFASIGLSTVDYLPIVHGKEDISHFFYACNFKNHQTGI